MRPFCNHLIVVGLFRAMLRCSIRSIALQNGLAIVPLIIGRVSLTLEFPTIALGCSRGHFGGCAGRFERCFNRRSLRWQRGGGGRGPVDLLAGKAAADQARGVAAQFVGHFQRPEPGDRTRRDEIPVVVGKADEIPDAGIGGPRATKGRTGQRGRDTGSKEGTDVAVGGDRVRATAGLRDRTQAVACRRPPRWRRPPWVAVRGGARFPPPLQAQLPAAPVLRPLARPRACAATSAR